MHECLVERSAVIWIQERAREGQCVSALQKVIFVLRFDDAEIFTELHILFGVWSVNFPKATRVEAPDEEEVAKADRQKALSGSLGRWLLNDTPTGAPGAGPPLHGIQQGRCPATGEGVSHMMGPGWRQQVSYPIAGTGQSVSAIQWKTQIEPGMPD